MRKLGTGTVARAGLVVAPAIWFGLLAGVSFLATPAKFLAPSLTLPVALEVGRATFSLWNPVEWLLLGLLILLIALGRAGRLFAVAAGLLVLMLLIQTAILLPILDERVSIIIAGGQPPDSLGHLFYIVIDIAKLQILGVLIWWQGYRLTHPA